MNRTTKIILFIILVTLGLIFLKVMAVGINKSEKNQCYKWAEQAKEYQNFFLADWQKLQCDHYKIEVLPQRAETKKNDYKVIEEIEATITAYSSDVSQTDDNPWEMASGKQVYKGAIACPSRYKFGTKVLINGEVYICEDRMAKRYRDKNNFDIWMSTFQDAKEFGVQKLNIKIIKVL